MREIRARDFQFLLFVGAVVGLLALGGLTVLGAVGILAGQLSGSDLVALAGAYTTIVGIVAGRPNTPGSST